VDAYRATLERLSLLAARSATVVPGHGGPIGRDQALALAEEDRSYLDALERDGAGARLPDGRRTPSQRAIHASNARRVEAGA
jgi:glyoxylase-like metal-dependent hydrolase (beta-lactamase superfamily II)